jgi:DNA-binding NarL/FixJ family response regulator
MLVGRNNALRTKREVPLAGLAAVEFSEGHSITAAPSALGLAKRRRVFLVEDHPVTREGFAQLIDRQGDLQVCGHAGTASKAMAGIDALRPDLVVADLSLSGSGGLELIKSLKAQRPGLPVLVLSAHDEALYAERSLRAGAKGYVMKHTPTLEVMAAIRRVLKGEVYLSDQMRTKLIHKHLCGRTEAHQTEFDALTDRELEVFQLLGRGYTTRRIATAMHVSISTVETHRAHIKEKLHLENAVELVRRAVEWANSQHK